MKREPLLQFFEYSHLPEHLQEHSKPFWVLAHHLCNRLPESAERTAAIRKLLEAKDCAVRASIYDETKGEVHERVPDHFFKTRPIQ